MKTENPDITKAEIQSFIGVHFYLADGKENKQAKDEISRVEYYFTDVSNLKTIEYNFKDSEINAFNKIKNFLMLENVKCSAELMGEWTFPFQVSQAGETSKLDFAWYLNILKKSNTIKQYFSFLYKQKYQFLAIKLFNFIAARTIFKTNPLELKVERIYDSNLLLQKARKATASGNYNLALISMRSYIAQYLQQWIVSLSITLDDSTKDNLPELLAYLNQYLNNHPQFKTGLVPKVWSGFKKILKEVQNIRNHNTVVHPNSEILSEFESKLISNSLEYLLWAFNSIKAKFTNEDYE
ncbi:hypothetical protein [Spiroplasma eriocheiris]|uniref:Abortive infection protein-like C-terminal domain-containing protein n=1 Tax=Spiroplasma eriocheiris TaxID=315358 RepID=A0A0H3XHR0_9MOLU|nr:hypothetical protein [Spiroplasma eriocheiris]AHF57840.1 hypothetical protein SPE_0718 [Spiroplasma eriocheiris CCTCC M 207170]AKM54288.1 hypothetical protein SERIO_v1c07240 [Spiroplasma eriocheiris]